MATDSKQNLVLAYFLIGGQLTVIKCLRLFHTTELRKIVSRLKEKGYVFDHEDIETVDGEKFREHWIKRGVKQPRELNPQFHLSGRVMKVGA